MPPEGFCDHSQIGGPSEENFYCTADMGLTQADTTAISDGWMETMDIVRQVVIGAGSWGWAFFESLSMPSTPRFVLALSTTLMPLTLTHS